MLLRAAVLAFVFTCAFQISHARISSVHIRSDDRPLIQIASPFGFSTEGHLDLEVTGFTWTQSGEVDSKRTHLLLLGFFLTSWEGEAQLEYDVYQGSCALDVKDVATILHFKDLLPGGNVTKLQTVLADRLQGFQGAEYSLFFANCADDTQVSFDVTARLYNVKGDREDFLGVGEDALPLLYMVMFVAFAVAATLWGALLLQARSQRHALHHLMTALVVAKALTLLSQAGMYHYIRATGSPDGWNIAFYVFTFLRGLLFFTVIVLVGTGWSYMKPLLAQREKRILMVVIPLQICAEVAIVILDEATPASRNWITWRDILHLVDIVCCCAVLFPIVWSIKHLREASETDGKAARNLAKLQLFRQFYVMVVSYIYFTRIVVYLLRSTVPYQWVWLADGAEQVATLVFYIVTAVQFRPQAEGAYMVITEPDDDDFRKATSA